MTKYQTGDSVIIRVPVGVNEYGPSIYLRRHRLPGHIYYGRDKDLDVTPEMIVKYESKPRVPEVGDVFQGKGAFRFKIKFVDEDGTWFGEYYYTDDSLPGGKTFVAPVYQKNYALASD